MFLLTELSPVSIFHHSQGTDLQNVTSNILVDGLYYEFLQNGTLGPIEPQDFDLTSSLCVPLEKVYIQGTGVRQDYLVLPTPPFLYLKDFQVVL